MEPAFYGRFEHSLDAKGRVILPAKYRGRFERGGFLGKHHGGCLALWTPEDFERQSDAMKALESEGGEQRNLVRLWASSVTDVEIDRRSGRMVIPAFLREYAGLETDHPVLIIGAIDRVELWSRQQFDARVTPKEQELTDDR